MEAFALSTYACGRAQYPNLETQPHRPENPFSVNLTLRPAWTEGITNRNMEKLAAPCPGNKIFERECVLNASSLGRDLRSKMRFEAIITYGVHAKDCYLLWGASVSCSRPK